MHILHSIVLCSGEKSKRFFSLFNIFFRFFGTQPFAYFFGNGKPILFCNKIAMRL